MTVKQLCAQLLSLLFLLDDNSGTSPRNLEEGSSSFEKAFRFYLLLEYSVDGSRLFLIMAKTNQCKWCWGIVTRIRKVE